MGIVGQTFFIFIIVIIIAFLVSVGIYYTMLTKIESLTFKKTGKGELESNMEVNEINNEIRKFEKLRGPDILANSEAIDEISNRLNYKISSTHLNEQIKQDLHNKVNNIKNLLIHR